MIIYQGVNIVYISIFLSLHVYLSIKFNIAYSVYLPDNIDPWILCLNKDKRICKYVASFHGQFVLRSFRFYANPPGVMIRNEAYKVKKVCTKSRPK